MRSIRSLLGGLAEVAQELVVSLERLMKTDLEPVPLLCCEKSKERHDDISTLTIPSHPKSLAARSA